MTDLFNSMFNSPVMLFPVNEVMEDFVLSKGPRPNRTFRASVVFLSALIAYAIPDFGKVRDHINITHPYQSS